MTGSLSTYPLAALPGQSAAFDTEPLDAEQVLVGAPRVRLTVTSSASSSTLFLSLWQVTPDDTAYLNGVVGYGKTYGQNGISDAQFDQLKAAYAAAGTPVPDDMRNEFPFWENFYSGGVTDVRGFQDNTLGPRLCGGTGTVAANSGSYCNNSYYSYAQPIGGAFKVLGTAELYLPLPFLKDVNTARVSWFVDTGNAYPSWNSFSAKTLRASTGLSLHWQSPMGPMIINFALPFRTQPGDGYYEERIQFTFGSTF